MHNDDNDELIKNRKEVDEIAARGLFKLLTENEDFKESLPTLSFTQPQCVDVSLEGVMPKLDERLTWHEQIINGYDCHAAMLHGAITFDGTHPDNTSEINGHYLGGYELAVYHGGLVDEDEAEEEVGVYAKIYFFLNDEDWNPELPEGQVEHEGYCICDVAEYLRDGDTESFMDCVLEGTATVFYTDVLETMIQLRMAEEFQ